MIVAAGGSLLDEIVRDRARQMPAAALQAEVTAYVEQCLGEVAEQGHRLVDRNGDHAERVVITAAGAVLIESAQARWRTVNAPRLVARRNSAADGTRTDSSQSKVGYRTRGTGFFIEFRLSGRPCSTK